MNPDEKKFLKQSKDMLDASAESLDAATLSRLNQARQLALQNQPSSAGVFHGALPATALASLVVIVITAWLWTVLPEADQQGQLAYQYEDMEILTSDTELELLEQLEFVSWLLQQPVEQEQESVDAG